MKILFWGALLSGPLSLVLLAWGALSPGVVEQLYSRGLYSHVAPVVSRWFASWPFPVAPVLLGLGLLAGVGAFFLHPRAWMGFLAGVSVLAAWFVLGWGLNYQRLSWGENLGWDVHGGTVADLANLAQRFSDRVGPLRAQAFQSGTPHWGALLQDGIPRAYEKAAQQWPLLAGKYPGTKAAPGGDTLSWLGISGIYMPFTGEPLVNTGPGGWSLPFTAAHESAHLRGWAREDEANFLAFLVLQDCGDPRLEYSAWSMALLYVASALEGQGPLGADAWKKVAATLPPTVLQDWKDYFRYWNRFRGPAQTAAQAVNDAYLKAQGQHDGVKSYGRMVDLLLAWETVFGRG